MKYILMMTGTSPGVGTYRAWSDHDQQAHTAVLARINKELRDAGEFVANDGLAGPDAGQSRAWREGRSASHRRHLP